MKNALFALLFLSSSAMAIDCTMPSTKYLKGFTVSGLEVSEDSISMSGLKLIEREGASSTGINIGDLGELEATLKTYPAGTLATEEITSWKAAVDGEVIKYIQITPGLEAPYNSRVVLQDKRQFVSSCM